MSAEDRSDEKEESSRVSPSRGQRDGIERAIEQMFSEILDLDSIKSGESFTNLGGNSIQAMQLVARLRRTLGVEIPLARFFDADGTIAELARDVAAFLDQ